MKKGPYLSVILPCYNEESNIKRGVLEQIEQFLRKQQYSWEVIIVDDGSTDGSSELIKKYLAKKKPFQLIENTHQGKAKTVTTGVLAASGTYILFSDFDQATPIDETEKLMPHLVSYDVVVGSRSNQRIGAPFSRLIMARGFMMLRSFFLGVAVSDTQCGFKAFKYEVAHTLFKKLRLYRGRGRIQGSRVTAGFDVELLFLASKMGYRIKEVPVRWRYIETRRVNAFRDSWEGLLDLLQIKVNDIWGKYA